MNLSSYLCNSKDVLEPQTSITTMSTSIQRRGYIDLSMEIKRIERGESDQLEEIHYQFVKFYQKKKQLLNALESRGQPLGRMIDK